MTEGLKWTVNEVPKSVDDSFHMQTLYNVILYHIS